MHQPLLLLGLVMALVSAALVVWSGKRHTVSPLVTVTWGIHVVLWCLVPLIIQQLFIDPIENSAGPWSREMLVIVHSVSLLVLVLLFLAFPRPYVARLSAFFDRSAPRARGLFWPMVGATALLIVVEIILTRITGASFADFVAFSVTGDAAQQAESGLLSVLLSFLLGFAIAVISLGRDNGVSRATLGVAWIATFFFCAFSIARGSRAVVLLPVAVGIIALSTLHGRSRKRATRLVVVLGILTIVVGAPAAAMMGYARGGSGTVSLELIEEAYTVVLGANTLAERLQIGAQEVNRKFDAIGPGVELLAMEPPGTGGLAPILSASVSPIPRILFLDKPVPTSRDGTYLGSPYRIAAKAYGDPEIGMVVPVSATSIGLWEFGALGPLVLILTNLLGIILLNTVLISRNVLARALGISMLNLPSAEFFVAPPSAVVQNSLRMLLYIAILAVAVMAVRLLRHRSAIEANSVTA